MARVADHLSVDDLEARLRSAQDPTATRHFQVIWLLARGHTIADVAAVTSFVPRWIEQLLARYNAHGPERPWATCAGAMEACRACCAPRFWSGCARGSRRLRPMAACGPAAKWRPGWPANSGLLRSCRNAAGRRSRRSTGRCRSRARAIPPRPRRRSARRLKKLEQAVAGARAQHPKKPIEVWATDEHRLGLKPIIRRVWAPKGQRPIALGHHRYKWLYVTAFVQPTTGETFWYISNGVSKPFFAGLLALFAREAGAGRDRIIVLGLDSAGWHTAPNLAVPDGIRLAYLPPYSPELQPAEHLWPVLDQPLANQYFETLADLERVVANRCRGLDGDQLSLGTNFHWWPKPAPRA